MSILKELEQDVKEIIKKAGYELDNFVLETSNRRDLGEYQINNAMQLAKTYHDNPRTIAEKIVNELSKDKRFENINIAGPGFINFSLNLDYCYDFLNKMEKYVLAQRLFRQGKGHNLGRGKRKLQAILQVRIFQHHEWQRRFRISIP